MFPLQLEIHVGVVGNLNKRYCLVRPATLAVEDHRSMNFT